MTKPVKIDLDGKIWVMMPEEEFEDIVDRVALSEIARENSNDEYFPAALVNAICEGENPIRAYRKFRGFTGEELARMAGISRPYLTQLETGKKAGSIEVLKAIAAALKVDLDMIT